MQKEIYPSSYVCDCGYQCDFSESTVREVKAASMKRKQELIADDGLHGVILDRGEIVAMYCPRKSKEPKVKPACGFLNGVSPSSQPDMKSRNRGKRQNQDLHFVNEDGMVACNPRDREAAHRAEVEGIATLNPQAVTCKKCLGFMRKTGTRIRSAG